VTPLYPQKLALTSPTSGSRSVDIVRSQTQATELVSDSSTETDKKLTQEVSDSSTETDGEVNSRSV
jgi:hypothetical protein